MNNNGNENNNWLLNGENSNNQNNPNYSNNNYNQPQYNQPNVNDYQNNSQNQMNQGQNNFVNQNNMQNYNYNQTPNNQFVPNNDYNNNPNQMNYNNQNNNGMNNQQMNNDYNNPSYPNSQNFYTNQQPYQQMPNNFNNQNQYQGGSNKPNVLEILKNNKNLIIKLLAVLVAAILVVVIIKNLFSGGSPIKTNAKKVLTCTTHFSTLGIVGDETYVYYINDGSASLKNTTKLDLEKSTGIAFIDGTEKDWANDRKKQAKSACDETDGCAKIEVNYKEGKYLETIVYYDSSVFNSQLAGMTAEEIYNRQKSRHENGDLDDGRHYSCY